MSVSDTTPKPGDDSLLDVEKNAARDGVLTRPSLEMPKKANSGAGLISRLTARDGETYSVDYEKHPRWYRRLLEAGVEGNGVKAVFFTCLLNLLPIPTGLLATLGYGMNFRDAALVILFFALLTCIPPAFMGTGGMETGMRQLVQQDTRLGGRYLVVVPLLLNAATVTGFCLLSAVVGGQSLAALNPGSVSPSIGIVITCLVALAVSLLGFKAVHFWERWTWIPSLISLFIAVGCGGHNLRLQVDAPPATASQVISYGCLIAGYFITFGGTSSDYTIYQNPAGVSKIRVFVCMYLSFLVSPVPLLILGAAVAGAVPNVPTWVPRFVSIFITLAIMIPCAFKVAEEWEEGLTNFLSVIGYWAGCFDAVTILELVAFRKMDYTTFDHAIWNVGRKLPLGVAALGASICSMGLVVPGMAAPWYTGPIAKTTGDNEFEMGFAVMALCYLLFRWIEIRVHGHL
ncbi:NCS1 nucleoside transporter [Immersiella caudata]|uniref:NCS1 nucleoside transporter n=1 Tax=Immersiella caudata TaxID=314043 RepID=A0AA39WRR6_9PEZI|nr:NCS1 nucleoside transporter [Immersiella caudata]